MALYSTVVSNFSNFSDRNYKANTVGIAWHQMLQQMEKKLVSCEDMSNQSLAGKAGENNYNRFEAFGELNIYVTNEVKFSVSRRQLGGKS